MIINIVAGWWLSPTPLKNDGVTVSWDDEIQSLESHEIHVPNHQPVLFFPLKPQVIENEPLIYQDLATNTMTIFP